VPILGSMPQDVFDSLVIVRSMASLTGDNSIIQNAISQYLEMYPNEDDQALMADIDAAAKTAWEALLLILRSRGSNADIDDPKVLFPVLNSLNDTIKKIAECGGPTRNASGFGGPTSDRIATCRKNISAACQEILRTSFGS
jgi:hypothetical protein